MQTPHHGWACFPNRTRSLPPEGPGRRAAGTLTRLSCPRSSRPCCRGSVNPGFTLQGPQPWEPRAGCVSFILPTLRQVLTGGVGGHIPSRRPPQAGTTHTTRRGRRGQHKANPAAVSQSHRTRLKTRKAAENPSGCGCGHGEGKPGTRCRSTAGAGGVPAASQRRAGRPFLRR